ncbi:MAG: iron export ABC transporter permease subunit FetB [Bacillota bacterium]
MDSIVEIELWRLLAAYIFLVLLLVITWRLGVGREKEIVISAFRMTVQLIVMGYVLVSVFQVNHMFISLGIFALMEVFAIRNVYSSIKVKINVKLRRVIVFSMLLGTGIPVFFFLVLVINVNPWYEARYFIPIAGMVIGNSMTGIALGAERLINGMKAKREWVEGALMLGATPFHAAKAVVNDAFNAAILPTINSMVGMGIVFLPGMMVGQILSGVSPLVAIEYQIAIMLGILGSISLTVYILMQFGYKSFFNQWSQLEI